MGFPAEVFLCNASRLAQKIFYYSCNVLTHEETNTLWNYIAKLKSGLLNVFIGSFARKPDFLAKPTYKDIWRIFSMSTSSHRSKVKNTSYFVTMLRELITINHLLNEFSLFFCLQNVYKLITAFLHIFVILNYLTGLFCVWICLLCRFQCVF